MKVRHIALVQETALAFYGQMAVEVALGGSLDASLVDVILQIDKAIADMALKNVIVTICADGQPTFAAEEVIELILCLKSRGTTIIGKSQGTVYPQWFPHCNYTLAWVDNGPWLRYFVNELRYRPAADQPLHEPLRVVQPKLLSLELGQQRDALAVLKFLRDSNSSWAVISPMKTEYTVVLLQGKAT